ncbi:hypothetical protein [Alteromonas sp. 009811495]|nr:hypothetical protein [Alteromonas sp. 009811495]WDT85125.1 hypothetical protein OZ660_14430 [Alteromonas sp. 009811495]
MHRSKTLETNDSFKISLILNKGPNLIIGEIQAGIFPEHASNEVT